MLHNQFRGTGVALITPFTKNAAIDYQALDKLLNFVIDGGVNYIVALGTTAETPTLKPAEKKEILARIIEKTAGRVPVVCGIGGNNTAEVVEQIKDSSFDGVAGILSVCPYYNKPGQEGIYQHYKAIASATDRPIILYNVPGRTGINMLPATVIRLANEFHNIIGIKEASGNMAQCMELVQQKPHDFLVLSGDDDLALSQIAIGMEGVISVAANCFPKDFTYMINASLVNKFDKARVIHYKILEGIRLLFAEGSPAGVKAVLSEMDLCENKLRLPMTPVSSGLKQKIQQFLKTL